VSKEEGVEIGREEGREMGREEGLETGRKMEREILELVEQGYTAAQIKEMLAKGEVIEGIE
jgi:flagellar biosynthesis/type III secretory pathway protein FliH